MDTTSHRPSSVTRAEVQVVRDGRVSRRSDRLATEEPMEIRIVAGPTTETVAVTMRTPGDDFELAAGFLFGEGVISEGWEISHIGYCADPDVPQDQLYNIVTVRLSVSLLPDLGSLERRFYISSACGICGKASLEALELRGCTPPPKGKGIPYEVIRHLPTVLRGAQGLFERTGGLHAAGLFDREGRLLALREDVGRHNAVDKLVGWALLNGRVPLHHQMIMVSGRASFEIMQKALAAGIPVVCAVSAPSSLAVDVARRFGMTLIGFLREEKFNIYSGPERVLVARP